MASLASAISLAQNSNLVNYGVFQYTSQDYQSKLPKSSISYPIGKVIAGSISGISCSGVTAKLDEKGMMSGDVDKIYKQTSGKLSFSLNDKDGLTYANFDYSSGGIGGIVLYCTFKPSDDFNLEVANYTVVTANTVAKENGKVLTSGVSSTVAFNPARDSTYGVMTASGKKKDKGVTFAYHNVYSTSATSLTINPTSATSFLVFPPIEPNLFQKPVESTFKCDLSAQEIDADGQPVNEKTTQAVDLIVKGQFATNSLSIKGFDPLPAHANINVTCADMSAYRPFRVNPIMMTTIGTSMVQTKVVLTNAALSTTYFLAVGVMVVAMLSYMF